MVEVNCEIRTRDGMIDYHPDHSDGDVRHWCRAGLTGEQSPGRRACGGNRLLYERSLRGGGSGELPAEAWQSVMEPRPGGNCGSLRTGDGSAVQCEGLG